uniref:Uncharacterized protein n=1 Tax=Oryza meridionalis TaxID=40149 RepID=A0A0E0BVW6_9ORYZ
MAGAVKRMVDNSYHDMMESIQAEESAAKSACNRLLAVSTLLEQQRGALEVVRGRMASWAIREVEMSAITAELLLLDDVAAGAGDAAARLRGIKTMLELVKLIKADDVTLTLATDDLEHYALKQPGDATFAPAPSPEELEEAMKHAEGAQEHVLRCCARVRAVVRCFQGVERVGVGGAEQGGVIAEGELGVAHKSLDAAVGELLKADAAAAAHLLASISTPPPTVSTLDDALLVVSVVHNALALLLDYNLERCILYLRLLGRRNDPNLHRHNRLPLARDRLRAACVMLDFAAAYCNVQLDRGEGGELINGTSIEQLKDPQLLINWSNSSSSPAAFLSFFLNLSLEYVVEKEKVVGRRADQLHSTPGMLTLSIDGILLFDHCE